MYDKEIIDGCRNIVYDSLLDREGQGGQGNSLKVFLSI
jgi:hypothetical protein